MHDGSKERDKSVYREARERAPETEYFRDARDGSRNVAFIHIDGDERERQRQRIQSTERKYESGRCIAAGGSLRFRLVQPIATVITPAISIFLSFRDIRSFIDCCIRGT